ncbi:phosphoglucosamine mutase [Clostridium baratii]|uniref:Phosphoglucosamine mutase n=1 Tax=Clostridium baratii str. Sullivan TaxID=1415775 RepID=A0A0A7FYG5_9CLOT|nr:phosphoglucosamine mutase [Clostridium baratii]AIY84674.1 phosphoglucosamine mutase [Clostridium baratii str. Sullivan]CUP68405.1 phosphoglucosamine mutase [Clostridium baratii]
MGRMFGTDGVRGVANTELTAELAYNLGRAGAYVLTEGAHKPKILVAKDTRISGDMLEAALVAGILSVGAEAVVLGVIPTPAVAHLTREYGADAGVMISASHNPVEYNGIKFFNNKGYKLSDELEDEIQRTIENGFEGVPSPTGVSLGRERVEVAALDDYIDFAKNTISSNLEGVKIALDCANGAAHKAAVEAFRDLGAEVYVINDNPDGTNINENCGSTHPEELMEYVVKKGCQMGFAFDGDADRCLAVDEKGNLINGDFILALCANHLKELGRLKDDTLVVTVMSNLGLDIACKEVGINLAKTKVGDRYVLEEMLDKGYVLGGEQSGHIIFLECNTTGDGLVTALQVASIVRRSNKTLSELCSIMKELPQVLVNAKVPNDKKDIYLKDAEIVAEIERMEKLMDGKGRVLIRPSGTEPLVRVMLEGENQEEIDKLAHNLADMILSKC